MKQLLLVLGGAAMLATAAAQAHGDLQGDASAATHGNAQAVSHGDVRGQAHGAGSAADVHSQSTGDMSRRAKVSRTVQVAMSDDMRFTPAHIDVRKGETVRFVVRNVGAVPHEMVLGTDDDLRKHAEAMRIAPTMAHVEPGMVKVAPGAKQGLVWTFDHAGRVAFACLVPGHLEAGMKGEVEVR